MILRQILITIRGCNNITRKLSLSREHSQSRQESGTGDSSLSKTVQSDPVRNDKLGSVTHLQHSTVLSRLISTQQIIRKLPQVHPKTSERVLLQIAEKKKKRRGEDVKGAEKGKGREKKRSGRNKSVNQDAKGKRHKKESRERKTMKLIKKRNTKR